MKKQYVDVVALITKEGKLTPLAVYWEIDDVKKRYEVKKIYDIKRSAANKRGVGIRYLCKIDNKLLYLYYDRNLWYISYP